MQVTHSAVKLNGSTSKFMYGGILNELLTHHKCIENVCSLAKSITISGIKADNKLTK